MGIKAIDNMCTLWTIRKITHSLQTYMKHVALEGIEYAPWWWSNSGDCSYNTGKEFLKVSSTGLDKLVLFRCTHWDWVKEKGNRSQQVSKEFYPLMLYPYLPYPSQLPSPEAEIGFLTSGFFVVQHPRMKCSYLSSPVYSHNIWPEAFFVGEHVTHWKRHITVLFSHAGR